MKNNAKLLQKFRLKVGLLLVIWLGSFAIQTRATNLPEKPADQAKLSVYIFLAETCPISQFYTLTLKELHQEFASEKLTFKGIFPNTESTEESVAEFKKTYALPFALIVDKDQKLTKTLKATITPEVIVKKDLTGEILYQGRIDDSYFKVGKKRPKAREHDLRNALTQLKKNQRISKPKTEAVGCYITFKP